MWYEGRWWISRALVKPLTGRRQDWIWKTMVIEYQHQTHKTEVFGTVSKKGFLYWEAASTVSVNACSIRPRSLQSTSSTALHTKLLVRVIGFGKSRHYHLLWDGVHDLEKGKKVLFIYTLGLPEPNTSGRSLVGNQRGDQVHQGLNTWHTPAFAPHGAPKVQVCWLYCSSNKFPRMMRHCWMETVSSVVLADLQFHRLNSACWGFTKLLIEYGRHCKSQSNDELSPYY